MTIDWAIQCNEALRKDLVVKGLPSTAEAIGLGIEALRLVKELRESISGSAYWGAHTKPLPGETEDKGVI